MNASMPSPARYRPAKSPLTARLPPLSGAVARRAKSAMPWQRVINSQGEISLRPGEGAEAQRKLLEAEGVQFDAKGRIDFDRFGWDGPDWEWLDHNDFNPAPLLRKPSKKGDKGKQLSLF